MHNASGDKTPPNFLFTSDNTHDSDRDHRSYDRLSVKGKRFRGGGIRRGREMLAGFGMNCLESSGCRCC